jgi:hypothetical protein
MTDVQRAMMITGQSGRNPVYVRLRVDVEQEDGTTLSVDQWIGKKLTKNERTKLRIEQERDYFARRDADQLVIFETALAVPEETTR